MGLFEDIFTPIELRNQRDIDGLRAELSALPDVSEQIHRQQAQIERLELITRVLGKLVIAKGLATQSELSVLLQQVDLEDGVEDGRLRDEQRRRAPRCAGCDRFINPKRRQCVYCGHAIAAGATGSYRDGLRAPKPVPSATCARCSKVVPETQTWFTGAGLVCGSCYDPASD